MDNYTKCFSCPGPYHPATGDWDPVWKIGRCGVCMTRFVKWMKGHLAREWSGHAFYEEAKTSVRAGAFPAPGEAYQVFQAYRRSYVATRDKPRRTKISTRAAGAALLKEPALPPPPV